MAIDPALPGQPYPLVAVMYGGQRLQGLIEVPWYNSFVRIANTVAGLGPAADSATITGWPNPSGGARVSVNGSFVQVAAPGYSQGDTQALINQVEVLSQALAQLVADLKTFGVIGT